MKFTIITQKSNIITDLVGITEFVNMYRLGMETLAQALMDGAEYFPLIKNHEIICVIRIVRM